MWPRGSCQSNMPMPNGYAGSVLNSHFLGNTECRFPYYARINLIVFLLVRFGSLYRVWFDFFARHSHIFDIFHRCAKTPVCYGHHDDIMTFLHYRPFLWKIHHNGEIWCALCFQTEPVVEQSVELQLICVALTLFYRQGNETRTPSQYKDGTSTRFPLLR